MICYLIAIYGIIFRAPALPAPATDQPMNVSLTPRLHEYVRRKVACGLYKNASEVFREGLRLMIERDRAERPAPALKPARRSVP